VRAIAERGVEGSAGPLPHLSVIQRAFGSHDLRAVKAYVGDAAARASDGIGAQAYTVGERVAFREPPDLHTAAHEAAHVVQQRSGVELPGGVGRASDRYEQHADEVAAAVVDHRPVEPLLNLLGDRPGVSEAVQTKEAGEADVDAITRAVTQAQQHPDDDGRMMLAGASIVYRLLRTFFPEYLAKWNFSGVGYKREYPGINMQRRGRNVEVTVGRRFVLDAKGSGLPARVLELETSLQLLEEGEYTLTATASATGRPPSRSEALAEAGRRISKRAEFGLTAGSQQGPDPSDSYDARYWKEEGRSIEATVEPWVAMSQMIAHLDDPVPKQGGGTTRWRFDCFEGADVERLYADWRMLSRDEFNKKNTPLKIGFMAYLLETRPAYFERPVKVERPGGEPYKEGAEQPVRRPSGVMEFVVPKIPVGKTIAQVLDEAPVGSWIIWTNKDVTGKLAEFDRRKAAGEAIPAAEESFINRIRPWENENALKVDEDRYAAFPFGVVDEKTIVEGMAKIVFEPNPVPSGYIQNNIYVSAVSVPK
jgi:hypothetical protein